MTIPLKLCKILQDYCRHTSLVGFGYMVNNKYHFTERLFWLVCFVASMTGSYYLIINFLITYRTNAISMVIETVNPQDVSEFPSVGVCEVGFTKEEEYPILEAIIEGMKLNEDTDYNYDVEEFMLKLIFYNMYSHNFVHTYCTPHLDCDDCIKCPSNNYQQYADAVKANCSEIFAGCYFNNVPFNCCGYFKPLRTSMGKCYLLNSIHVSQKDTEEWIDLPVGLRTGPGHLRLEFNKPVSVNVFNEEDIPLLLLDTLTFRVGPQGYDGQVYLFRQRAVNDKSVRSIDPISRKCYFPDEEFPTKYKYYSFSVCVTECLKRAQLNTCNCTHFNMIVDENDDTQVCDYDGLYCLDENILINPRPEMMQPWRRNSLQCQCFPSCNEHEIKVVEQSHNLVKGRKLRAISIRLQHLPNQRFRRQTMREKMDVVVSIGGILGLFLGASILSLVEFAYFFTVRALGSYCQRDS